MVNASGGRAMIERVKRLVARVQGSPPGTFFAKWSEDNGPTLAVTIAYYALFSLFPLLLAISALVGYVVKDPDTLAAVEREVITTFPGDLAAQISDALFQARENA